MNVKQIPKNQLNIKFEFVQVYEIWNSKDWITPRPRGHSKPFLLQILHPFRAISVQLVVIVVQLRFKQT